MKTLGKEFKNASVTLTGGAGLLLILGNLNRWAIPYEEMSPVPGLSFLTGLAWPVLCIWTGLLLRQWLTHPRRWVQAVVAVATVFFLYEARHSLVWWESLPCQYLMCIGAGFLLPEEAMAPASGQKGWVYAILLMAAAFCYTAVSVVAQRIQWHPWAFGPEHEDMKRLAQRLLLNCETLLVMVAGYFAVMFSSSRAGQWLGSQALVKGITATLLCLLFFASLGSLCGLMPGQSVFWTYLIHFLVQPATLYLIMVIHRIIRKLQKKELTWKDVYSI